MNEHLNIYDKVRSVPELAKKPISGGRLNGKTDINPMWRIKILTETFGPVGIGWKYEILKSWLEKGANEEIAAFVEINLYYVDTKSSAWSAAIPGTGGSMLVAKEKSGLYTSDECYKMALTDALSVACKAIGVGADVYWDKDSTKYDTTPQDSPKTAPTPKVDKVTTQQIDQLKAACPTVEEQKRLGEILKARGIAKASEIPADQFKSIYDEILGDGLPFQLA